MKTGLRTFIHHPAAVVYGNKFRPYLPTPKSECNYHSGITLPRSALGNSIFSDCVPAGILTLIQLQMGNAMRSGWVPSEEEALELYSHVSQFNLTTRVPDRGTELDTAESFVWRTGVDLGFQSPIVLMPVQVDIRTPSSMDIATEFFGGIALCFDLPAAAQNLTVWDFPAGVDTNSWEWHPGTLGGHFVASGRYEQDPAKRRYCVSWGMEIPISQAWIDRYLICASAFASRTIWFDPLGKSPAGFDWDQTINLADQLA